VQFEGGKIFLPFFPG
jgi:hypothetical protein